MVPFDYPEAGGPPPASGPSNEESRMLKRYDVTVNGRPTTLLLSDEDAKAQGLLPAAADQAEPAQEKQAPPRANKARKAPNKKA